MVEGTLGVGDTSEREGKFGASQGGSTMRLSIGPVLLIGAACMLGTGQAVVQTAGETGQRAITVKMLNSVIGELGVPLGTIVPIKATVVDGDGHHRKDDIGKVFLRVTEVNGRELADAPVIHFDCEPELSAPSQAKVGNAGHSDPSQLTHLKASVGKQFGLTVYETGRFRGMPMNDPNKKMIAAVGFGFTNYLVIVDQD